MMFSVKRSAWLAAIACALACLPASAQDMKTEPGIAINDQLTINKCGGCHSRDSAGMMRRLSYMRTTPEVWEESIKRMVRLNGLSIQPAEAHEILRYLSANNGLAPEEAKPIFWEAEHRLFRDQSDKVPADALQHTCNYCHTIGRVLGQRRTREDYEKLISTHIGLFPGAENQFRPRRTNAMVEEAPMSITSAPTGYPAAAATAASTGVRADGKYPVDVAIDYLSQHQPLMTPEWAAWRAAMRTPGLAGKWMLIGYQQGKGRVFGTVVIQQGASADEFTTKTDVQYAGTGAAISRTGKGVVYTGYSWRGRSSGTKAEPASSDPSADPKEWREAMFVSRDGNVMDGRWFWGGYEEFGIDAHLVRIGSQPMLAGANTFAVQTPSTSTVKLYGENFPPALKSSDFDFGPGIKVKRIVTRTATTADVELQVDPNLPTGVRDISLGRSTAERSFTVYDKVAYIKVLPDASMARLGGTIAAKQFAQFEAVAYSAGADGKPNTADDIPIGPIPAHWGLEEFESTPNDDDVKFVGKINDNGLFTPNLEGPNPERKKQSNNYPTNNWGDVWVTASYDTPGGTPIKARSYLVVTIPVYMHYDQPEVSQ
jgi:quinohemoprotein amine dehydrogenase